MKQSIFLADDEPAVREVLSAFLMRDGFAVETFADGKALVSACDRKIPDLVIMDVMMPGMDGLSACSALRRKYPHLPIMFISSKNSPDECAAGLARGADDYLCKPFLPAELASRAKAFLGRGRNAAGRE